MSTIRWGMIGCGSVTELKSGPAFYKAPGSALVAVMGRREEVVRDYAARHGIARTYTDAQALVNDPEVDAVYIATPPDSHLEYSLLAAAAGLLTARPRYSVLARGVSYSPVPSALSAYLIQV